MHLKVTGAQIHYGPITVIHGVVQWRLSDLGTFRSVSRAAQGGDHPTAVVQDHDGLEAVVVLDRQPYVSAACCGSRLRLGINVDDQV